MKLSNKQISKIRERYKLSKRELDFIKLFFEGVNDNLELSQRLNIAFLTAKLHVTNIYKKLGVNNKLKVVIKIIDECKLLDFDIKNPPKSLLLNIQEKYNFTPREMDLIKLLFKGITVNKELSKNMGILLTSAALYLVSVYRKTYTNNKLALIINFIDEN